MVRGYSPALFPQLAPQQAAQEHEAGPQQRDRSGLWRNAFRVALLVVAVVVLLRKRRGDIRLLISVNSCLFRIRNLYDDIGLVS